MGKAFAMAIQAGRMAYQMGSLNS